MDEVDMDDNVDLFSDLLHEDQTTPDKLKRGQLPRPIQVGIVRWHENMNKRCAHRGCSSPTMLTLRGIPYCTVHLIHYMNYELSSSGNRIWIKDSCTCKAGQATVYNTHTQDCAIYDKLKELNV